jgi:hypothetical protein
VAGLGDERRQEIQGVGRGRFGPSTLVPHRLCRGEGEAALKDGEELELRLLGIVEQVVAPGDGVAHRLLAVGEVARSSSQEW